MKKVKIVSDRSEYAVETYVNQFIAKHEILDIQFQYSGDSYRHCAVMIVYEEDCKDFDYDD